ncbi:zinc finger, C3HC4 type [Ancylostoma duodenale]|uniref:Zinc finger, C3HC4 type n=1 Tax=Ancylostoma duodenale TaxID=51022 RepID=A0A0C2DS55_9BILA|nr:zinc finger, C3HC4 type [Ancylostoma duodenale]
MLLLQVVDVTQYLWGYEQRMVDKCVAEDGDEQEASCSDDACCVCLSRVATVHAYPCGHKISCRLCATMMLKASAKAQEKHFRCIMCRANVYRLRYVRPDPVVIVCKVSFTQFPYSFRFLPLFAHF